MSRVGSTVNLFAPVERAIHGDQADCVMIDEGWAFDIGTGLALETSIRPAQATRRHRQLWLISAGGTEASTWLIKFQKLGRAAAEADNGHGIAYFEWSAADHLRDVDPYDRDLWWATHPALGYTIEEATIAADAETMDPAEFARAYLCVPTAHLTDQKIPAQSWGYCGDPASQCDDPIALAFDVALERDAASIAIAGLDADGHDHVEVIDNRGGTGWVADRVEQLYERWPTVGVCVDPYGPARSIADDLERRGVIITRSERRRRRGGVRIVLRRRARRPAPAPPSGAPRRRGRRRRHPPDRRGVGVGPALEHDGHIAAGRRHPGPLGLPRARRRARDQLAGSDNDVVRCLLCVDGAR